MLQIFNNTLNYLLSTQRSFVYFQNELLLGHFSKLRFMIHCEKNISKKREKKND